MTERQSPLEQPTPWQRFTATYKPLYRTLLLLGTLSALFSLTSLANVHTILATFEADPFYAAGNLINTLLVPAIMIASLILLWNKHPLGIRLRLTGYGVSILATILTFFISGDTLRTIIQNALDSATRTSNTTLDAGVMASIAESSFYTGLYLSIGISLAFSWLWIKAWNTQRKSDNAPKEETDK